MKRPSLPGSSGYRLFFKESMRSLGPTASVVPSSRYLAEALTRPIDFNRAKVIVELGPGTGPMTRAILSRMSADARLIAIDINPAFIDHLHEACPDPRLVPVCGSATDLRKILAQHGFGPADAIVSSLGLTSMDEPLRAAIMQELEECLTPGGTMTQFQYIHAYPGHLDVQKMRFKRFNEPRFLRNYFSVVHVGHEIRNFPPALVFTCRK
ncbi:MAG: methyltransferase domain-containing protein [Acidobacteriota bacterium]